MSRRPVARAVVAILIIAAPLAALAGAELGADRASREAAAAADRLRAAGRYADAIAVNRALAERTGPLHLLSRGPVDDATTKTQAILIDWATSLAARGRVDQAVFVLGGVTQSELVDRAREARASILLAGARASAASDDFRAALARLDELRAEPAPAAALRDADDLRAPYDVGAAPGLVRAGRAADAVGLLDDALSHGPPPATAAAARSMLPSALLSAARQSLEAENQREAQRLLLRLQYEHPSSRESRSARQLLERPQPVTGTLVQRKATPVSAPVRLSGHFRFVGDQYLTSPPFFLATAGPTGDFTFSGVPPGGPYVLEVLTGGQWTTSIDPTTGRPATSFTVDQLIPVDLAFVVAA